MYNCLKAESGQVEQKLSGFKLAFSKFSKLFPNVLLNSAPLKMQILKVLSVNGAQLAEVKLEEIEQVIKPTTCVSILGSVRRQSRRAQNRGLVIHLVGIIAFPLPQVKSHKVAKPTAAEKR